MEVGGNPVRQRLGEALGQSALFIEKQLIQEPQRFGLSANAGQVVLCRLGTSESLNQRRFGIVGSIQAQGRLCDGTFGFRISQNLVSLLPGALKPFEVRGE